MAKKTTLHDVHVKLGARVVDFHGWLLPVQYESVLSEHRQCRSETVVFDTGHMGLLLFRGAQAGEALGRVCTQDAASLRVGRCRYGFLLNENAGILDDTVLMRLGEREFLLVVNAGTLDDDWRWLREHLEGDIDATNLSSEGWGKIDLQGPSSACVLATRTDTDLASLRYFGVTRTRCCGRDCILGRTGYTGELGYEIIAPGADLPAIFEDLLDDGSVAPAGLGARDSLRLEMCYPLYGQELGPDRTPLEAGLGGFVDIAREFIGAASLRNLASAPRPHKLAAFRVDSRRRPGEGDPILLGEEPVGAVTSGAFSPSLETAIGLGYVRTDLAEPGQALTVRTGRADLPVIVGDKPLYKNGTCRAKDPLAS
jgi:glycine cleavage system T protein (aminomethyltransferase)